MKAEISFNELCLNPNLLSFFFRSQAENTIDELLDRAGDRMEAIDKIDDYAHCNNEFVDELEELFYSESVENIAKIIGIELVDGEE